MGSKGLKRLPTVLCVGLATVLARKCRKVQRRYAEAIAFC
jgi:hypothetical protein